MFALVKPDYIEEFPPMDADFEREYMKAKKGHLDQVLDNVRGAPIEKDVPIDEEDIADLFN